MMLIHRCRLIELILWCRAAWQYLFFCAGKIKIVGRAQRKSQTAATQNGQTNKNTNISEFSTNEKIVKSPRFQVTRGDLRCRRFFRFCDPVYFCELIHFAQLSAGNFPFFAALFTSEGASQNKYTTRVELDQIPPGCFSSGWSCQKMSGSPFKIKTF